MRAAADELLAWEALMGALVTKHLFKLPDLTSFPSPFGDSSGVKPQTYHEHKVLPYTRRQLYAVVADVGSYAPSFLPFCTRSRVLRPRPPSTTTPPTPPRPNAQSGALQMEAELTVAFLAFTEHYTSRVTCVPHESVRAVAVSSTPLFKMLETTWRFQPAASAPTSTSGSHGLRRNHLPPRPESAGANDTGPTLLSLDLAFEFANPLHGAVSGAFFGKVSALMVKAFEERCVKVYGPG
ncbi:dehydrase and lipid transport-domain-containing protein [Lactarius hengduanensis]|nr:dehydrase and lipid transport-domain-containing protein [Lactarius hengduanensis]